MQINMTLQGESDRLKTDCQGLRHDLAYFKHSSESKDLYHYLENNETLNLSKKTPNLKLNLIRERLVWKRWKLKTRKGS